MSFIVFKKSILPIEHSFQGFGYPGWVTGNNSFYPFGMKFDIIFRKMLVNVLTCQLNPRKTGHASPKERCVSPVIVPNLVMLLLRRGVLALS